MKQRPTAQLMHDRSKRRSSLSAVQARPRVLVADNDLITQARVSELAVAEHWRVVAVQDGAQTYRLLKSDSDFQAMVINPAMPGIDTVELLRYMKSENRLKRIPIVVVIGDKELKLSTQGFAAGAVCCLWKPLSTEVLGRALRLFVPEQVAKSKAA